MKRATVTVPEAGEILGVGRNNAYSAAEQGILPTIRIGRRIVVPMAALEKMLARVSLLQPEPEREEAIR